MGVNNLSELFPSNGAAGIEPATSPSQMQRPNHSTIEPPRLSWGIPWTKPDCIKSAVMWYLNKFRRGAGYLLLAVWQQEGSQHGQQRATACGFTQGYDGIHIRLIPSIFHEFEIRRIERLRVGFEFEFCLGPIWCLVHMDYVISYSVHVCLFFKNYSK